MTKYMIAVLALSISVFAVACGGGEQSTEGAKTPDPAPAADPAATPPADPAATPPADPAATPPADPAAAPKK
jgi:hypothetical protein